MSNVLRAQFFCSRPDGTLTPLVAVDELPANITIRGVPRVLSPGETQGMTSLGSLSSRGQCFTVEGAAAPASRPPSTGAGATGHRTRGHDLHASLLRMIADENIPANQRMALSSMMQQSVSSTWHGNNPSTAGWLVPNNGGSPNTSSGQQTPHFRNIKKEYCSYWIRHGECDYQQQGCLYKHEMPHDRSMLEKLGLRDIPRWYREKYNIASILPNGHGHPRSASVTTQPWKDDGNFKSIQYPPQLGPNTVSEHSELEKAAKQRSTSYLPAQQYQQAAVIPGASQMAFHSIASPTAPVPQSQTPIPSPGPISAGNKKIDLLSFDHGDYLSNNNFLRRPSNEISFEAPGNPHQESLVRNLHSLSLSSNPVGPGHANIDFPHSPFDSTVGAGRFKKSSRAPRLYQPRPQDAVPDSGTELADNDSIRVFHNQATTSSSGASATSKTTNSHLASPVADAARGSITSEPPTRGSSPAALSFGASPGIFRGRGKDKTHRKPPGVIGSKKTFRKRSTESFEDDMFCHGKK
ncbi:hypothetical protein BJY04DRAFT_213009 [Aspergillus karnatakaensis]|uniref:uncharacterized protein n=1 Tax=Aspergillus karnatakaensis TaxID=1810916 RepID=UPI003CCE502E